MRAEIASPVRTFIEDSFLFREDKSALTDTESLLEAGLIDSTGILELVAFLEERFDLRVDDADLVPANFDSIEAIAGYVERMLAREPSAPQLG